MEFAFVSVTGAGVTKSTDVHIVRSHSMRGVNKKQDSRRSRLAMRREKPTMVTTLQASPSTPKARFCGSRPASSRTVACSKACGCSKGGTPDVLTSLGALRQQAIRVVDARRLSLFPTMSFSDRWLVPMACCEDASSRELLFKYGWFKRSMYPAHRYIDFELIDESCAGDIAYHEGLVHATLYASAAIEDFLLRRPFSRTTLLHLHHTLQSLKATVAQGRASVPAATAYVVMSLCIVANVYGDGDALSIHLAGLKQLNIMEDKLGDLLLHPLISFKTDALDLAAYMCKGTKSQPAMGPTSWESAYPTIKPAANIRLSYCCEVIGHISDRRLITVFWDLRQLSLEVEECFLTTRRLGGSSFRNVLCSLQSRLIQLEETLHDPLGECLRLGMLALLSTNFRIPTRRLSYTYLRDKITQVCSSLESSSVGARELQLWLLMVSAMSVFEPREPWIRTQWAQHLENTENHDWSAMQSMLCGLIWIPCMHDDLGKETYDLLQ